MISTIRRVRVAAVVLGVLAALAVTGAQAALASASSSVPFTDPSSQGSITLCGPNDQPQTSGNIDAVPFIWKAVASTPPPSSYQGTGENTVLNIFQPRPEIEASEWSGDQLTGSSFYTTAAHPAAQATQADIPLSVIIGEYPPQVDGLYQLRMAYGKANYGLYTTTYPTAVIRVTGNTWTLVQGGPDDCSSAKATSDEVLAGSIPKSKSVPPTLAPLAPSNGSSTASAVTGQSHPAGSGSAAPAAESGANPNSPGSNGANPSAAGSSGASKAVADEHNSSSSALPIGLGVGGAVVLAVALGGIVYWRRSQSPGPG